MAVTTVTAPGPLAGAVRLDSIDAMRGVVMVLMALDHARFFFTNQRADPLDLDALGPEYFLTRWITHFVAPTFVFLAGTAAWLQSERKTRRQLAGFLLSRGVWLIVLELTVITFAWTFEWTFPVLIGQVIWAIGWSMVALAALIFLPTWAVGAVGLGIIALHNLTDGWDPAAMGAAGPWWAALHVPYFVPTGDRSLLLFYPILPWIGVIAAGYAFGPVVRMAAPRRHRWMVGLGVGAIAAFLVLRAIGIYGEPLAWNVRPEPLLAALEFLNTTKYPPSLLFLLMTLGPMLALLPLLERLRGEPSRFLVTFGRVPLFYYVLHMYAFHALAMVFAVAAGGNPQVLVGVPITGWPSGHGWDLPIVYLAWIGVVLVLWPVCRWFADVKRRRRDWWLSYL